MRVVLILLAMLAAVPASAQDASGAFTVSGIAVDFAGKTTDEARFAAYREAQRRAWPQLWSRMTGNPVAQAPKLADSALDAMVAGIEVEAERFTAKRYIGRLGVVFDRVRASKYLGASVRILTSPPMLLLPVLDDGGVRTVYERRSPWLRAWARFRAAATPMQYVRADGTGGDAVLLTAWQAKRDNRQLWRVILSRYQAADVLTAEAKLDRAYPGGPVSATFTARHGPDATVLARFKLSVRQAGDLPGMLDEGVRRIDAVYGNALRAGLLKSDENLGLDLAPLENTGPQLVVAQASGGGGVLVNVATPDAASWGATQRALRATPSVTGVAIDSLSLGGVSQVRIASNQGYDWLLYWLDQRGLRLAPGAGGTTLRGKVAGDPPIARPLTPEEIAARAAGLPPPGTTPAATPTSPATPAPAASPAPAPTPEPVAEDGPRDLLAPPTPTP